VVVAALIAMSMFVGVAPSSGFAADEWRTFVACTTSHTGNIDPIVSPGQKSMHTHAFSGNTRTSTDPNFPTMIGGPLSSSCELKRDTAAYWAPLIRNQRTGEVRAPGRWNVYYVNPWKDPRMVAFPPNFMAVSDDVEVLGLGDNPANGAGYRVWFRRVCWDGTLKMASGTEYRAHTTNRPSGGCPAGYKLLPKMHYNVRFPGLNSLSGWESVSEPMAPLHGDFWNTWHQPSLEAIVEACLTPPGTANGQGCGHIGSEQDFQGLLRARGVTPPPITTPVAPTPGESSPTPTPAPQSPKPSPVPSPAPAPAPAPEPAVDPLVEHLVESYQAMTPEQQREFRILVGL
jgi:hypothetical protein